MNYALESHGGKPLFYNGLAIFPQTIANLPLLHDPQKVNSLRVCRVFSIIYVAMTSDPQPCPQKPDPG